MAGAIVLPLESRLGGLAYYDPNLDITWAASPNTSTTYKWDAANAWAASVTIGGVGGWRLPNSDVNGDGTVVWCSGGGAGCAVNEDNEMDFLYWDEGITSATPGVFGSVPPSPFWSSTDLGSPGTAWGFDFSGGGVFAESKTFGRLVWAVHSGDVALLPAPPATWLFATALLGLAGFGTRKRR